MKPLTVDTGICIAAFSPSVSDQELLRAITDELGACGIGYLRTLVRPLMPKRKLKTAGFLPELLYVSYPDAKIAVSIYSVVKRRLARKAKNAS